MKIPYKIRQIEEALKKSEIGLERIFNCKFCDLNYNDLKFMHRYNNIWMKDAHNVDSSTI